MKALTAKVLLMIILLAGTPLGELVKLPMLFVHMVNHMNEDPAMTLADFFDMHYSRGLIVDEDYHQDMSLPFKAIQSNLSFVWGEVSVLQFPNNQHSEGYSARKSIGKKTAAMPSSYLSSIWQPPRLI